ncbi:MAG: flagellar biosynthesis protein FlhF [Ammonifex sp.]|nr:MAG: flagellar biosynthesis protein FlhF [Ammonifex sp.]
MRIKRFTARDMQEAVALIKQDMGPEAVIISSRWVRGRGLLGFMAPQLEVTAALDEQQASKASLFQQTPAGWTPEDALFTTSADGTQTGQGQDACLRRELLEVKELLARLSQTGRESAVQRAEEDPFILKREQMVAEMEIKEEIVAELISGLKEESVAGRFRHNGAAEAVLIERITRMVEPVYKDDTAARSSIFVGPTGVGKTTTMAKLAAQFRLFHQKKVALSTIDTYRIGAVDQLRTYAEIIDVPLEVAMTPTELKQTLANHKHADHILIDTAGRPSRNLRQVLELKGFIEVIPKPCDIFLVLSCNTKYRDILRAAEDFQRLSYNKLIFTKLDETESFGALLNLVCDVRLPVVYVTDGQSVPDDIKALYPRKLAELLVKGGRADGPSVQAANPRR